MTDNPIGDLHPVDPATLWKTEAGDFVPWLATDRILDRLSCALGLDLEPVMREAPVGRFRADLLCRDRGTDARVVIEAQLGPSDHAHLGQLLTYAMGLPARTVVWLSTRFHAEHCAAVDGLNRLAEGKMRCFAVAMDVWKIAASPAAPQFTVFAAPYDWPGVAAATPGFQRDTDAAPRFPAGSLAIDKNPIRVGRLRRGLTVEQLAKAAGISRSYLSRIETDLYRGSPETRAAIEKALDLPPRSLVRPVTSRDIKPETGDERRTEA